jgi:Ca2+-binding RTX toxin-like protein
MKPLRIYRFVLLGFFLLIVVSLGSAYASSLTFDVTTTSISQNSFVPSANEKKPSICAMYITSIINGSGTINGDAASNLIYGGAGNDTIYGGDGNDCIYGLGGDDTIDGGDGTNDICIGGGGTNTFINCESTP